MVDVNVQALGRRVGPAPRQADRDGHRAGSRHAGVGPPRLGAGRRDDRGRTRALPRARRPAPHVRRGARAVSARLSAQPHDDAVVRGGRARPDRCGGGRRRERVRAGPRTDRQGGRHILPARCSARPARPCSRRSRSSYFVYPPYGRELDVGYDREYEQEPPTDLEPALVPSLVGAADAGRLQRVHGDALRPDPARALQGEARDDRAQRLGRAAQRGHRRPRALAGRAARPDAVRGRGRERRRRRPRPTGPSGSRASATGSRTTARRTRSGSRTSRRRSAKGGRRPCWFTKRGADPARSARSSSSACSAGCSSGWASAATPGVAPTWDPCCCSPSASAPS